MSEEIKTAESEGLSSDEMQSALFAQLVIQQANMAMMLLGQVPHPETGKSVRDLEAARLFIDQLEMLQAKTRGNLTKPEESLLKQSLMSLRLAFVEATRTPEPAPAAESKPADSAADPGTTAAGPGAAEESKKRFSKKFEL